MSVPTSKPRIPEVVVENWGTMHDGRIVTFRKEPHTFWGDGAVRVTVLIGNLLVFEANYVAARHQRDLSTMLRRGWFVHCADCGYLVYLADNGERECGHR